jgi:hypothetical protein
VLATIAVAASLSGCTSSGAPAAAPTHVSVLPPSTPELSSAPPSSPEPVSSPEISTTPAESTTPVSSSATPTPTVTPTAAQTTCAQLSVRVIQGGAAHGEQTAGLQFVNDGTTACVVAGYPTVTLLLHGQIIGRPSIPATDERSQRRLQPGEVAESLLHDYTQNCQAPLSDSVRVQIPGSTESIIRPGLQLRACVLRVDKLGPPD